MSISSLHSPCPMETAKKEIWLWKQAYSQRNLLFKGLKDGKWKKRKHTSLGQRITKKIVSISRGVWPKSWDRQTHRWMPNAFDQILRHRFRYWFQDKNTTSPGRNPFHHYTLQDSVSGWWRRPFRARKGWISYPFWPQETLLLRSPKDNFRTFWYLKNYTENERVSDVPHGL